MLATLTGPITASAAPRHAPPTQRTNSADPLPYRVWTCQRGRWACVAAFSEYADAMGFGKKLRRRVPTLAFQSPSGVDQLDEHDV